MPTASSATVRTPADLAAALKGTTKAGTHFRSLPPSHRREYIQWITSAKQAATRHRRITKAVEMLAAGKRGVA